MKRAAIYLIILLALVSCGALRQGTGTGTQHNTGSQVSSDALSTREIGIVDTAGQPISKPEEKQQNKAEKPSQKTAEDALSDQVIAYARSFLGTPYKLGASGPKLFDCSGFTRYVFKHFGYNLTQYTGAQFNEGREVAGYGDLQKGDLVFFGKRGSVRNIGHVGIVVSIDETRGSFRFIHASTSGGVIESESTQAYYLMRYIGARRILPDEAR